MTTLGSYIYRLITKVIFSPLLLPDSVQGIYLRRSAANNEAILGKSDVDTAIIIDDFKSAQQELPLIRKLSNWYSHLRSLCPILGELFIFNRKDLTHWNRNKPFRGMLARHWIRLYGDSLTFEDLAIPKEDILAEFCFWLFDMLPGFYIKKDIFGIQTRHCVVALLEMYNAFFTLENPSIFPKARKNEILDYLIGKDEKYKALRGPLNNLKTNSDQRLKHWIYKDALKLAERMFSYSDEFLRDTIEEKELISKSPPAFVPTKYVFKDDLPHPAPQEAPCVHPAPLKRCWMNTGRNTIHSQSIHPEAIPIDIGIKPWCGVHNIIIVPTTPKALNLYLGYWNPWEYYSLCKLNRSLKLPAPSGQAMRRYFSKNINRHLVRYPLIMDKYYSHYRNIILQARLLNDYNIICTDQDELISKYKSCYGDWSFSKNPSRKSYLKKEYEVLWDITTRLYYEFEGFNNNSC